MTAEVDSTQERTQALEAVVALDTEFAWRSLVRVTISIDDLPCGGGDSVKIERQLASLAGVAQAYVNPLTEMAYVAFDPSACNVDQLRAVIHDFGFQPGEAVPRP